MQEEDEMIRSHETLHEQQHQQQAPAPQQQQQQQSHATLAPQNLRKVSIVSEDSDIFMPSDRVYSSVTVQSMSATEPTITIKPPYLSIQTRHTTTSTESKDTLTPIDGIGVPVQAPIITSSVVISGTAAAAAAAVATDNDDDEEDASTENIMELNFETARQKAMRRRSMGRRLSSECCSNYDLNRSQTSLNAALAMSRRQLSLTQSEPDSGNELTGI